MLYKALFEICDMRAEVSGLSADVPEDAARLLSRLEVAERAALHLIEHAEAKGNVLAH